MRLGGFAASLILAASLPAWAQVQVVRDRGQPSTAPKGSEARALFLRVQALERQVLSLQGLIEELNNKLELLRALQRDQFGQLERRLSLAGRANGNGVNGSERSTDSDPAKAVYRSAHDLMQKREFGKAKQSFERYLASYPNGDRLVDALFWLGELSLVVTPRALELAKRSFSRIIDDYPDYKRMPTVLYKMAKIHHSQGNGIKARALLKQVIREHGQSNSNAVELAQAYLAQNFPADS